MAEKKSSQDQEAPESKLEVGQRVRVLINGPLDQVVDGTIRVLQDEPGKLVGVELDNYAETGHTLDNALDIPEKADETSGRRFGKGWWTREEHIEVL